jgi:hypothetical protein
MPKSSSELRRLAAKRLASRLVRDHLGEPRGKTSADADTADPDTADANTANADTTKADAVQAEGANVGTVKPDGAKMNTPHRDSAEAEGARAAPAGGESIVCVVHGRQTARKIVSRALASKLDVPVHRYSSCEDALRYTDHYNTFVVYNNFGKRMNGARGVERIRMAKPEALIIGVTSVPNFRHKFRASGADDTVLLSGNEVGELASKISRFYANPTNGPGGR